MADITQNISTFPPAPDSGSDTPTEFNAKADAFVNHQSGVYVGEVNNWSAQANSLKSDMNQIKSDVDNIVATIPAGTIDDTTPSDNNTYSSNKIEAIIPNLDDYVELAGDTMTGNLEAPSMSIGGDYVSPFGFRNYIINGGFDIWQRGSTHIIQILVIDGYVVFSSYRVNKY